MKSRSFRFLERFVSSSFLFESEALRSFFLNRIFEGREINEKAMSSNITGDQPWSKDLELRQIDSLDPVKDKEKLDNLLDKLLDKYIIPLKSKFESSLKRAATKDAKIITGSKSISSIKSKMQRGRKISNMGDLLRAAILVKTEEDAKTVLENMRKIFNIFQVEEKEKGSDTNFGYYGSYHCDVDFHNVICEVQIMTKRLWNYKDAGHSFYDKWREKIKENPEVMNTQEYKNDAKMSKMVFDYGNGRSRSIQVSK